MRMSEILNHRYLVQIPGLNWIPVDRDTWEIIQDEGLDEEFDAYDPGDWVVAGLNISKKDAAALVAFEEDAIEDFNRFDIGLKERFPGLVDFIDYDAGTVKIVTIKGETKML